LPNQKGRCVDARPMLDSILKNVKQDDSNYEVEL
jgi:hypothetical protein